MLPNSTSNESSVKDTLMGSSRTFREVTLYGKKIFITESSAEDEEFGSITDALILNGGLHGSLN